MGFENYRDQVGSFVNNLSWLRARPRRPIYGGNASQLGGSSLAANLGTTDQTAPASAFSFTDAAPLSDRLGTGPDQTAPATPFQPGGLTLADRLGTGADQTPPASQFQPAAPAATSSGNSMDFRAQLQRLAQLLSTYRGRLFQ